MPRKSRLSRAAHAAKVLAGTATRRLRRPGDAAKAAAGAALGAAAIATTVVVAKKVADVIREGGEQVGESSLHLQRVAVSRPLPKRRKRAARQTRSSKKKTGSVRLSRKRAHASQGRR